MTLTVLSVGYPLAPVSPDSAGGAEQILAILERAIVEAGHRSIVVAPEGSSVRGTLHPVALPAGVLGDHAKTTAQLDTKRAVDVLLARDHIDVVHMHGVDFQAYLPQPGVPVLATLHLPPDWYPADALHPTRPNTWHHCVSATQHAVCPASPALLPPIENGIPVEAFGACHAKRRFALFLGRICPEKGVHLAIEAAREASMPLIIAGQVYPYAEHQRYFDNVIRPQLGPNCRFIGSIGFARKRRLLTAARCLLVPSLAAETASLVSREAAACGTPVVAFPNGAMAETIEHGRTGFLVRDSHEMAAAIGACAQIAPATCRETAAVRFSDRPMVDAYLALYSRLALQGGLGRTG